MNTAQPIRNNEELLCFMEYYQVTAPNSRNNLMMVMGLNTALRISDILGLQWEDVYDFKQGRCKVHLSLVERKIDKHSLILLNQNIKTALAWHMAEMERRGKPVNRGDWLFENQKKPGNPISRIQAFRIVKRAAAACHLEGVISCHSLRKTFGYYAWRQGVEPALLMNLFNHSSFAHTLRYLGIEQDDRDRIFRDIYCQAKIQG